MGPSAFEKLFTTSVPHVLEKIFFSLDYESFKACHEVCKDWSELLSTESSKQKANKMLTENGKKLRRAVRKGSVDKLRRILFNGMVDVNCRSGKYLETSLHRAVDKRHKRQKDIVQLLLDSGADPNKADKTGHTPLHFTARWGYKDVVELLMDRGAEVDMPNEWGSTPLHYAAWWGNKDAVRVLLDGGADPFIEDKFGQTPLSEGQSDPDIAEMLNDAKRVTNGASKFSEYSLIRMAFSLSEYSLIWMLLPRYSFKKSSTYRSAVRGFSRMAQQVLYQK